MAPDFGGFIAELSALFPADPGTDPPPPLPDRWLTVALTDGLQPLPPDLLTRLLRHPPLLAALQERIALDGGAYWDTVSERSDDPRDPFVRGRASGRTDARGGRRGVATEERPDDGPSGDPESRTEADEPGRRTGVQAVGDRQHRRRRRAWPSSVGLQTAAGRTSRRSRRLRSPGGGRSRAGWRPTCRTRRTT